MYRKLFVLVLFIFLLVSTGGQILFAEDSLQNVRLIEVVHSIFYAPQYVALEEDLFKEEELFVELSTVWGGDKAAASIMAGSGDIALIGPESTIYIY